MSPLKVLSLPQIKFFGIDIFCLGKKYLVYNMINKNLKLKYRRSSLGILWTFASPLSMAIVYYFVFQVILKIQIPNYLLYILSGFLPWGCFTTSISTGLESILGNCGLITKAPIPPHIFPYVESATQFINLIIAVPILYIVAFIQSDGVPWTHIFMYYYFILLAIMTYSLSLLFGVLFVFFRDLRHIIAILLQIWFYATPILYTKEMIPPHLRTLIHFNPVGDLFVGIREVFVFGRIPPLLEILIPTVWAVALFYFSLIIYKKYRFKIVEAL